MGELARQIGVSREIVGRYDSQRMADAFEVSLDYLVGNSEQELDKTTLNRVQEINKLSPREKELVFEFLDAFYYPI